uniref:Uncharacterized protein n=1 Tax=Phlebotomus papatasi TaxID=29031 RepID=A0A1B0DFA4_PHLPP
MPKTFGVDNLKEYSASGLKNTLHDGSNLSEEVRKFRKVLLERSKLDEDDFRKDLQSKNLRISYNFGRVVRVVKLPNIDMSSSQKLAEKIVNLISGRDPNEIVSIELKAPTVRNNIGDDYREYEMDGSYFDDLYKLPNDDVRTEEIDAFLDKLVFAVNQPNEDELGDIIRNELGREYNNIDTEIVYSRFLRRMLDWMKEKKGRFFSHEDGRKFFGTVKEEILGKVWFDVKDPVAVFTGREEELIDLHEKIQRESGEKTVISQMTSISGFPQDILFFPIFSQLQPCYLFSHSVYGYSRSTPLHLFAEKNINGALEFVLEYTKEKYPKEIFNKVINIKDIYSRTPLYVAAENGYLSIVELLVEAGADLNIKSTIDYGTLSTKRSSGWTPLHIAAYNGHADVVRFLAAKDQKLLDIKDTLDRTPLLLAINAGQKDVVMSIEHDDGSLLHTAVQDKDFETIRNLLSDNVGIVNSKLGDWTPLHLAAFNGDLSIVEFLIQKIEEQNISKEDGIDHPSNDGFTPLHAASSNGHLDVVMFLISQGANVQAVNDEGWTILHAAAQNGCLPVVQYLIDSIMFNVNIHDQKNDTPLHTAAFHGKQHVVEFLLRRQANINAVNVIGITPTFSAALNNNQDIVYFLLDSGAKVTTDDKTLIGKIKFSLIHLAAMYDNVEMIKYLIDIKGIDKDIGKDDSLTPLHVAAFFGNVKSIDCLIEKGANVDAIVQVSKGKAVFDSVEDMASNIPSKKKLLKNIAYHLVNAYQVQVIDVKGTLRKSVYSHGMM